MKGEIKERIAILTYADEILNSLSEKLEYQKNSYEENKRDYEEAEQWLAENTGEEVDERERCNMRSQSHWAKSYMNDNERNIKGIEALTKIIKDAL